jgi:hypothetical protein
LAPPAPADASPEIASDWDEQLDVAAVGDPAASDTGEPALFQTLAAPVPAEAAAYAAEATADEDEDMGWEGPPEVGSDGRGPWLDGPDAPWGTAPAQSGRRALLAAGLGAGIGLVVAIVKLFWLS